jgi:Mg2+ and Co2+ transporter CorA
LDEKILQPSHLAQKFNGQPILKRILIEEHHAAAKTIGKITWIDFTDPTESEIHALIEQYQLPGPLLFNSLDPEHLPQIELEGGSGIHRSPCV